MQQQKRECRVPKGTRDFHPEEMLIRTATIDKIKQNFQKHGAVQIDTPVFELKETLLGQYQQGEQLIYDINDQGGQLLSLRYDLTVPFCRYMATYGKQKLQRFHIAKVYRRQAVRQNQGRYREFYQCDFDIAGNYDPMIPDAECIKIFDEILTDLDLGTEFLIKTNNRKILDGLLAIVGIKDDVQLFQSVCSAIDKLDKTPWDEVRNQLISKKLSQEQCDKIGKYVVLNGSPSDVITKLESNPQFMSCERAVEGLNEMKLLFEYLQAMGCVQNISFDLSLARGLGYYTGLIFEACALSKELEIGSIVGGGRYDKMIGEFSGGKSVGAVGGSVGIERIFDIIEQQKQGHKLRPNDVDVFIATVGSHVQEKLALASELWDSGIKTEFLYKVQGQPQPQLDAVLQNGVPIQIWIGENQILEGCVTVQLTTTQKEHKVKRQDVVQFIQNLLELKDKI